MKQLVEICIFKVKTLKNTTLTNLKYLTCDNLIELIKFKRTPNLLKLTFKNYRKKDEIYVKDMKHIDMLIFSHFI